MWKVINYTNSTTAYGTVTIDGQSAIMGDMVGAFVGKECRAVQRVVVDTGIAYVTLVIQGEEIEDINFKVLKRGKSTISPDIIYDVPLVVSSDPGGNIGYPPDYLQLAATSPKLGWFRLFLRKIKDLFIRLFNIPYFS